METEHRTSTEPNYRIRKFRLCDFLDVMYWYSCREHFRCYGGFVVVGSFRRLCFWVGLSA